MIDRGSNTPICFHFLKCKLMATKDEFTVAARAIIRRNDELTKTDLLYLCLNNRSRRVRFTDDPDFVTYIGVRELAELINLHSHVKDIPLLWATIRGNDKSRLI